MMSYLMRVYAEPHILYTFFYLTDLQGRKIKKSVQ